MRGIIVGRSATGHTSYKLDKTFQRTFKVFGHNGLKIGAWWPKQICALRDGAHGSSQGGIAGTPEVGAYSVIISGGHGYEDQDYGGTVWYSGSGDRQGDQPLTNKNQALVRSVETRNPIRVIRCAKRSSQYAPSRGFRYDGLYDAVEYRQERGPSGFLIWRFKLVRLCDQEPIRLDVPSPRIVTNSLSVPSNVHDGSCSRSITPIPGEPETSVLPVSDEDETVPSRLGEERTISDQPTDDYHLGMSLVQRPKCNSADIRLVKLPPISSLFAAVGHLDRPICSRPSAATTIDATVFSMHEPLSVPSRVSDTPASSPYSILSYKHSVLSAYPGSNPPFSSSVSFHAFPPLSHHWHNPHLTGETSYRTLSPPYHRDQPSEVYIRQYYGTNDIQTRTPLMSYFLSPESSRITSVTTLHSPSSTSRYVCHVCNKSFSRPSSLRIHSYSHTGQKPFACPEPSCSKRFSVRSNMRRHMKIHLVNNAGGVDEPVGNYPVARSEYNW